MTSTGMGLQSLNAIWPTSQPAARRDVLIVCPDERQREEYAGLFEQRGWTVECRRGKSGFEKRILIRARQRYEGNIARAARAIGIPRPDLQAKMRALAMDIESTRAEAPEYAAIE